MELFNGYKVLVMQDEKVRGLLYNIVTIVNNTVLCTKILLRG